MRLKNYINIPDKKIREVIQFVRPNGLSNFDIRVSNSRHDFCETVYVSGCCYHDLPNWSIVVRVTRNENGFPLYEINKNGSGYINSLILSREEALVHVTAHELRHLRQTKVKKGDRVWGARGRFSDRDADTYAIGKTREWDDQHNNNAASLGSWL